MVCSLLLSCRWVPSPLVHMRWRLARRCVLLVGKLAAAPEVFLGECSQNGRTPILKKIRFRKLVVQRPCSHSSYAKSPQPQNMCGFNDFCNHIELWFQTVVAVVSLWLHCGFKCGCSCGCGCGCTVVALWLHCGCMVVVAVGGCKPLRYQIVSQML